MNDLQRMLNDIDMEVHLTRQLIGKNSLDDRVMEAMKNVPRHEFLPADLRYCAYDNGPAPIGSGQTISQPYIVALMSDLLETKPTDIILEIGTGSGYQAAILSELVQQVYSIEIIDDLATAARKRLNKLGYDNIEVRNTDGYFGWPEHAPYDGVIVTAAAPHIPQPLIDQLRTGARLVIPVGFPYSYQELMVVEKRANGEFETQKVLGVSFVPLTGEH
jgi:protein-L-isoaspartate(D-aspartate) O-methyltransferase